MSHWLDPIIAIILNLVVIGVVLQIVPLLIWLERKGAAYIQDRPGPERAAVGPLRLAGLFHVVADAIKLFFKESVIPAGANRFYYIAAPVIVVAIAFSTICIVPFFDTVDFNRVGLSGWPTVWGQVLDIDPGILWFFAIASLTVYGIIFAGWSSNNKYSLLGAMRASAAVLSYEIPLGLSVIGALMLYGTVSLPEIARWQGAHTWGIFLQPIAAIIFIVCAFAETNRVPFDLAESESELVAGYHTEYSAMKFGMFFLAEYSAMVVSSALFATLFLGGWQVPFLPTETIIAHIGPVAFWTLAGVGTLFLALTAVALVKFVEQAGRWNDVRDFEGLLIAGLLAGGAVTFLGAAIVVKIVALPVWFAPIFAAVLQFHVFLAKVLFLCWVFVWVRWTLPRFRYDQVMNLGWRTLLPLALVNILLTGVVITVMKP
ncbi:MAG: complex I subunit 1 family protein [Candidatus Sericytochromatia bacterium]|nr:complex I subunit 1 family protein [Candidatus Sericytochromatia bacterium]